MIFQGLFTSLQFDVGQKQITYSVIRVVNVSLPFVFIDSQWFVFHLRFDLKNSSHLSVITAREPSTEHARCVRTGTLTHCILHRISASRENGEYMKTGGA